MFLPGGHNHCKATLQVLPSQKFFNFQGGLHEWPKHTRLWLSWDLQWRRQHINTHSWLKILPVDMYVRLVCNAPHFLSEYSLWRCLRRHFRNCNSQLECCWTIPLLCFFFVFEERWSGQHFFSWTKKRHFKHFPQFESQQVVDYEFEQSFITVNFTDAKSN